MKRTITVLAAVLALGVGLQAVGHAGETGKMADKAMSMKAKPAAETTLTGEIVDTGCYISHGARGAKHKECAAKCISEGMPMGLLTADGTLYLITMNHDNADAYNAAKNMAAETVLATGTVSERNGVKAIDLVAVKVAPDKK